MELITISMFKSFSIMYNDQEVSRLLNKSPKSISVLKYLILNQDKPVAVSNLIDIFWNEEEGYNPENALKTLISRIRKAISQKEERLKDCIVAGTGTYQWKPNIPCEIDFFLFESICIQLLSLKDTTLQHRELFEKAIWLYKGNLDAPFSWDEWIKGRSMYYQELYLKVVMRYIVLLKEAEDYTTIIDVCRMALEIEAFNEDMNLELMYALKETNQNNAALIHYRHFTDMHYKYLGIDPSEKTLEFYKQLIKSDLNSKDSMAVIKNKLLQQKISSEAFVCDFSIFKDIYRLQMRNIERLGVQMFLILLVVEHTYPNGEFNPFELDSIMQNLMQILIACLRKGDIITRYSSSQFAVLLQMNSQTNSNVIIDRIRSQFYKTSIPPYVKLMFQIDPILDV